MHRYKQTRDVRLRNYFQKFEKKKCFLYFIFKTKELNNFIHNKSMKRMYAIPKCASVSKIKNRCLFTGKTKSVLSKFKMSRHVFRKQVNNNFYIKITKK